LHHSTRKHNKVSYSDTKTPSYPESAPKTPFEHQISFLNNQSISLSSFSDVDNALMYSLLSSKRRTNEYRSMIPDGASSGEQHSITKEQGIMIRHI
ncbi:hypothetical protein L208DRAFT_1115160, partial [Tricholoma matsutake]